MDNAAAGRGVGLHPLGVGLGRAGEAESGAGAASRRDQFGHSVALSSDGNTAMVGGPGNAAWERRHGGPFIRSGDDVDGAQRWLEDRPRRAAAQLGGSRWRCPPTATPRSDRRPERRHSERARSASVHAQRQPGVRRQTTLTAPGRGGPLAPVRCRRGPVLGRKHGPHRRRPAMRTPSGAQPGCSHGPERRVERRRRKARAHERDRVRRAVREQRGSLRRWQHRADGGVHRGRRESAPPICTRAWAAYGQCSSDPHAAPARPAPASSAAPLRSHPTARRR